MIISVHQQPKDELRSVFVGWQPSLWREMSLWVVAALWSCVSQVGPGWFWAPWKDEQPLGTCG